MPQISKKYPISHKENFFFFMEKKTESELLVYGSYNPFTAWSAFPEGIVSRLWPEQTSEQKNWSLMYLEAPLKHRNVNKM